MATIRGSWATGTIYAPGDIVSLVGGLFTCLQGNVDKVPDENPVYWAYYGFSAPGAASFISGDGAPTNGTSGSGAGIAGPGSLYADYTNGVLYSNSGTKASPTWAALALDTAADLITVINSTGVSIARDQAVYINGYNASSGVASIALADQDAGAKFAQYVTTQAIADGATGVIAKRVASQANINTNSASAVGDPVYLSGTAGGWTLTAPTAANGVVQEIGRVMVKSATVGQILWDVQSPTKYGTNELQPGSVTGAKLATGQIDWYTADGQDETMTAAITITPVGSAPAIVATDEVIACMVYTTKASLATQALRSKADFTPGAGIITVAANAANNTNNQYLFVVEHHV